METKSFLSAIEQICEEKGISKERVIETIEMALAAAYKKEYGFKGQNIKVKFDLKTNKMKVFQVKLIVEESMLKSEDEEGDEDVPMQDRDPDQSVGKETIKKKSSIKKEKVKIEELDEKLSEILNQ